MAEQKVNENILNESTLEKKKEDTVNQNSETPNANVEASKNDVKTENDKKSEPVDYNDILINYLLVTEIKAKILSEFESYIDKCLEESSSEAEEKPKETKKIKMFTRPAGRFEYDKSIQHQLYLEDFKVVGLFGRDVEGVYKSDESILKYLHIPPSPEVEFDLTLKHEKDEKRTSGLTLQHWYKWIIDNSKDEEGKPIRPMQRFIVLRCMLQSLISTPYSKEEGWDLTAVELKGSIYLELESDVTATARREAVNNFFDVESQKKREDENKKLEVEKEEGVKEEKVPGEEKVPEEEEKVPEEEKNKNEATCDALDDAIVNAMVDAVQYDNMDMYGRYGGKFEQYLSSKSRDVAPDPTEPLRKYEDFCLSMRAYLGRHSLLYAGEMDALPKDVDLKDVTSPVFVELKTMNKEKCHKFSHKRYRLLKWWAQCTLAMCRWVLVGYRDDTNGMVRNLERIDVFKIPYLVDRSWDARQCFTYLNKLLDFIDETVSKYPQGTYFKFLCRPKKKMNAVFAFAYPPGCKLKLLPSFYLEWLEQFADTKWRILDPQQNNESQ